MLKDKVAVITGAGGGLGQAVAKRFAKEGAKLVLVDLKQDVAQKTIDEVSKITNDVHFVQANVTKKDDVQYFVNEASKKFKSIDVFFNNAGIDAEVTPTSEYDEDMFGRVMEVNTTGVFLGMKYVLQVMHKQQSGSIINTASVHGLRGMINRSAYVASKHAVVGLTKTAAVENAQKGIRVNAVAPGPVFSEITIRIAKEKNPDNPEEHFNVMRELIPANRLGKPEDIANAVNFLASDETTYMTGIVIPVDGGMTASYYRADHSK